MALDVNDIARIDALIASLGKGADRETVAFALRALAPGLIVRHCDADDVTEAPFRAIGKVDLHLLDASNHCIRLTGTPERATGFLLAERAR